jgi:hypothetical protein
MMIGQLTVAALIDAGDLLLFQDGLTEELIGRARNADPEPLKSVFAFDGEGAIAESDTHRPKIVMNTFEMLEGCFGSRLSSAKFLSAKRWTRTGRAS